MLDLCKMITRKASGVKQQAESPAVKRKFYVCCSYSVKVHCQDVTNEDGEDVVCGDL
jgi:hypothetical protein